MTSGRVQADEKLLADAKAQAGTARVITVKEDQSSLALWEPICLRGDATSDEVLLLVPDNYELLDRAAVEKEAAEVRLQADPFLSKHTAQMSFEGRC